VSGAKLDSWIVNSLPKSLIRSLHHVALRGRQKPEKLNWFDRMMQIMGSLMNRDRQAAREDMQALTIWTRPASSRLSI
jgi:hypothetical protein